MRTRRRGGAERRRNEFGVTHTVRSTRNLSLLFTPYLRTSASPRKHSFPFQQDRGSLAAADAQRGYAKLYVATAHFVEHGENEASAGRADRVAEGDRAAVDIEFFGIDLADRAVAAELLA